MKKTKRVFSFLLAAAMVLGLLPGVTLTAEATVSPLDFDRTTLGKYTNSVQIGERYVINPGLKSDTLQTVACQGYTVVDPYGSIGKTGEASETLFDSVVQYNMFQNFSLDGAVKGFTVGNYVDGSDGKRILNSGMTNDDAHDPYAITIGTSDGDDDGSITATLTIAKNPTLKAMAEGGSLEFYFSGLVCGAKTAKKALGMDWLAKDSHTKVKVEASGGAWSRTVQTENSGKHMERISTDGWQSIGASGTITIKVSFNGNSGKKCGLCNGVLLFRVKTAPQLKSYTLYTDGDYRYSTAHEILLKQKSKIGVDLQFQYADGKPAYVFPTMMGQHIQMGDSYKLLSQLANHKLFNNALGTGEANQGEAVYLKLVGLNEALTSSGSVAYTDITHDAGDGADLMVAAAKSGEGFKSMQYVWVCSPTDYNNNQPFLQGADWDGLDPKSNSYSFVSKLYYASLHDLAGSPLVINNKNTYTMSGNDYPKLGGVVHVQKGNAADKYTRGSSSAPEYAPLGWADYVADGIQPKYTLTANGVQPDILTGLKLNAGDSFTVYLNFYEGVQARQFNEDGTSTGMIDSDTKLVFKNGLVGTYMPPDSDKLTKAGSRQWKFRVTVDKNTTEVIGDNFLEVDHLENGAQQGEAVLTDYVGNRMTADDATLGEAYNRKMSWARLQIDNTVPTLVKEGDSGVIRITGTDAGVGLFRPENATSGTQVSGDSGLVYYTWVSIPSDELAAGKTATVKLPNSDTTEQVYPSVKAALNVLAGNTDTGNYNYAAVKRYSLTAESPSGYTIASLNNGGTVAAPEGAGSYYLLGFAADMTWDSARQLIEYDNYQNTRKTETGAREFFAEIAGDEVMSSGAYEAVTSTNDASAWSTEANWQNKYTTYYYLNNNSYQNIPALASYPEWASGKYYGVGYTELSVAEKEWDSWKNHYTEYYTKNNDDTYTQLQKVSPIPGWQTGTYYKEYLIEDAAAEPGGFPTNYYEASTDGYTAVGVPVFAEGAVYTLVSNEARTIAAEDIVADNTDNNNVTYVKVASEPSSSPYYRVGEGAITSEKPTQGNNETVEYFIKWDDVRQTYFKKDGNNYYLTETPEAGEYYTLTASQVESKPDDWNTYWWEHQTGNNTYYAWRANSNDVNGNVSSFTVETYVPVAAVTAYEASRYYRLGDDDNYVLLTAGSAPGDWGTGDYYEKSALPVGFVAMETEATYAQSAYYKKIGTNAPISSETAPSDWITNYTEYQVMSGGVLTAVTAVEAPAIVEGTTYYKYGYSALTDKPLNWENDVWQNYSVKSGSNYIPLTTAVKNPGAYDLTVATLTPALSKDGDNILATINGTPQQIYETSPALTTLADAVFITSASDSETVKKQIAADKAAFLEEIAACSTYLERVNVVLSYQEFNEKVLSATQKMLMKSRDYRTWTGAYEKIDSNWTFQAWPGVDKLPPYLSGVATVREDNTNNPTVDFTVRDDTAVTALRYKFVAAGSAAPDANGMATNAVNFTNFDNGVANVTTQSMGEVTTGSYDLYVYAEDAAHNHAILKVATVKYNAAYASSSVTATLSSNVSAGTAVQTINDMALTVKGEYKNAQPYADTNTGAKIDYALSTGIDSSAITTWTEINVSNGTVGTADASGMKPYTVTLPQLGETLTGTYYVHVKLTYNDRTYTTHSAAYVFDNEGPQLSTNTLSSTGTSVTVSVSARDTGAGVKTVWYQWADAPLANDSEGWIELTGSSVTYTKQGDETAKTLYVKAEDQLGNVKTANMNVQLNGVTPVTPGSAPTPAKNLLAVDANTSVIELTLDADKITANTEYSYALVDSSVTDSTNATFKWSRWMPFESMVSIGAGAGSGKSVVLRFREGGGDATALETSWNERIAIPANVLTGTYATVSRSTLNNVGQVKLVFSSAVTKSNSELITTDTIDANGVYEYTLGEKKIYVSVSNIISAPPTYSIAYSTTELTAGSVGVTVTPDAMSEVIAVSYTPAGGTSRTEKPSDIFTFTENGSVTFTLDNGYMSNGTAQYTYATATVNWIDTTGPVVATAVTGWPDAGSSLSSGAYIKLSAASKFNVAKTPGGVRWIEPTKPNNAADDWDKMTVVEDSYYSAKTKKMETIERTVTGLKEYTYFVEENGTYSFTVMNALGATNVKTVTVSGIVKPFVLDSDTATVQNDGVTIQVTGKMYGYGEGNRITSAGMNVTYGTTTDGAKTFTLTRKFSTNAYGTQTVTDTAGNRATFSYAVSGVDLTRPTITVKAVARVSQGSIPANLFNAQTLTYSNGAWTELSDFWNKYVTVTDDNTKEDAQVTFQAKLAAASGITKNGSYAVILTATDKAGNVQTRTTSLMVMPTNAMMITDENGVLFYSGSSDVALVNDNEITLTISDYNLMQYGINKDYVRNSKATVEVFIQEGLYREGQMKQLLGSLTFDTTRSSGSGSVTYDAANNTATLTIDATKLTKAGWYTIIIRNSEREREYTTFFIQRLKTGS